MHVSVNWPTGHSGPDSANKQVVTRPALFIAKARAKAGACDWQFGGLNFRVAIPELLAIRAIDDAIRYGITLLFTIVH